MMHTIKKLLSKSAIKYLVTGGLAFIGEYGTFLVLFYLMEFNAVIANTVGFCIGLIASFSLNRLWTFNGGEHKHSWKKQALVYGILAVFNLLLTNFMINVLVGVSTPGYVAKLILMVAVVLWNFIIFKRFIFVNIDK